ncbi:hypothetical protein BDR06DRAFT_1008396 [Suillus hirtellus]|nr:hypothetical protein BDR06DRAFT_1008396 [Suillus hirtellus]
MSKNKRILEMDDAQRARVSIAYFIVSRKLLLSITKLSGNEFLSAQWQTVVSTSTRDIPQYQECARTIPFMALGLLSGITETVIEGKVKYLYWHDAESFISVLTWVSSLQGWQAPEKGKVVR